MGPKREEMRGCYDSREMEWHCKNQTGPRDGRAEWKGEREEEKDGRSGIEGVIEWMEEPMNMRRNGRKGNRVAERKRNGAAE